MRTVFASAADSSYGFHLLNLLGSLRANSDVFDSVVVYDLGLNARQRGLLELVPDVEIRHVPPFAPHWAQGFTWKPWIWTHLDEEIVFYLDAGATLLRSLEPAVEQIRARGYFLASQGNRLADIVPPDYAARYGLDASLLRHPYVAAGITGFATGTEFYRRVVVPTYEDCLAGLSLGFSPTETPRLNRGLGHTPDPPIRDCRHFRWDQTVFNLRLFTVFPDPAVNELDEYAGWRSPRDHPEQVIWSHRRQGDLRYLKSVPYQGRGATRARLISVREQWRWWLKLRRKYVDPLTYRLKGRRLLGTVTAWTKQR